MDIAVTTVLLPNISVSVLSAQILRQNVNDSDLVVSLSEETELDLETVEIGTADDGTVLAFTIEGIVRGLDSSLIQKFVGKDVIPTEIHFSVESR